MAKKLKTRSVEPTKEYIDYKGKGTKIEFSHSQRVEESKSWSEDRQIPYDALVWAAGFWWILLPDDRHPEAVTFKQDNQIPARWVHRSKCLEALHTRQIIDEVNQWYKQRGGRPPRKQIDAESEV